MNDDHICNDPNHTHDTALTDDNLVDLHSYIDLASVTALNESIPGSCKNVFKSFTQRSDEELFCISNCESDDDDDDEEELIIHVPFTQGLKITAISLTPGSNGTAPKECKIFTDRDDIDFNNCTELLPAQTITLVNPDEHTGFSGTIDYPLRPAKFQNCMSCTLYFPKSFGGRGVKLLYVGFRGAKLNVRRGVVEGVYEVRGMKEDHTVPDDMKKMGGLI